MNHNAYEFPLGIIAGPVGFRFKPLSHSESIEKPLCILFLRNSKATEQLPGANCGWLRAFGARD